MNEIQETRLTEHHQLSRVTVSLSHHVGSNTHIHASVTFPAVGNHQLSSSHLKMRSIGRDREDGGTKRKTTRGVTVSDANMQ